MSLLLLDIFEFTLYMVVTVPSASRFHRELWSWPSAWPLQRLNSLEKLTSLVITCSYLTLLPNIPPPHLSDDCSHCLSYMSSDTMAIKGPAVHSLSKMYHRAYFSSNFHFLMYILCNVTCTMLMNCKIQKNKVIPSLYASHWIQHFVVQSTTVVVPLPRVSSKHLGITSST